MGLGVTEPDHIDLVSLSPTGDTVQVVIVLSQGWTASNDGLAVLQAKVHNAVGFAADGQMRATYPEVSSLPWEVVIDCQVAPGSATLSYVELVGPRVASYGGKLRLRQPGEPWT